MAIAIIQARMSSSRLPGKVLKPICGRPMLDLHLERIKRAESIERIVIATSDGEDDDEIETLCDTLAIACFRGSLDDVLDRYFQAWRAFGGDPVVRLTGDCPLADPALIDQVVDLHIKGGFDYTSNIHPQLLPDGLDVEVMSGAALDKAWREAVLPSHREHVTFYFTENPELFKLGSLKGEEDHSELRWTVDYPEDFEMVRQIYEALYPSNARFGTDDILALLTQRPELSALNSAHKPGEGWVSAFERDKEYLKTIDEK